MLLPTTVDTFEDKIQHTEREDEGEVPHVWGRKEAQMRILRQGACPLLKCRVERKDKSKWIYKTRHQYAFHG
ncbi:MAG TPA: hypothetical protein PLS78_08480, partial [bacterium]|nr:hypothetical protein [bacterium]